MMQDPSNDMVFLNKFKQGSRVLDRILGDSSFQGHNDGPLLHSNLDLTLFNVNSNRFRKRKVQEFLDDYANSTTETALENEINNTLEDEEETIEIEQSPETIEALNNLDFVIDGLFKKVLKEHQV
jgi:hypothetical protein